MNLALVRLVLAAGVFLIAAIFILATGGSLAASAGGALITAVFFFIASLKYAGLTNRNRRKNSRD